MRAYSIAVVTLASLFSLAPLATAQDRNASDAELRAKVMEAEQLSRSRAAFSRSVRDMATWDFAWLATNPNWVVAEIAPSVIPTRLKVKASTPRTFVPLESNSEPPYSVTESALSWDGAVLVLKPLGTTPERPVWPYRYVRVAVGDSIQPDAIGTEAHEAYSPFIYPPVDGKSRNVAFCSMPETIQNVQTSNTEKKLDPKFHRAHILSEDVLEWVIPARTFYEVNPAFFSAEKAMENRVRLVQLLDDPNPFLFSAAVRTLAKSGQLDGDFIAKKLMGLDKFRQAVFVYSTLLYSSDQKGLVALSQIQQAIGNAKNKGQLEGLIIGADQASRTWKDCVIIDPVLATIEYGGLNVSPSVTSPKIPTILRYFDTMMVSLYDAQTVFGIVTENDKYLAGLNFPAVQPLLTKAEK